MASQSTTTTKGARITGWVLCILPALFLLMGSVMNILKTEQVTEGLKQYGYPESIPMPLGIVLGASTLLYLFPRTGALGAILLTGYLGGAVATHVRAGDPLGQVLFPVLFGAVIWVGLVLRDARLRVVLPQTGAKR